MSETLDIANLGTLEIEGSGSKYEAPSAFYRPIDPGTETVVIEATPGDDRFYPLKDFETKQSMAGFSVNLQFKILGGKQDGKTFFAFIDTRRKKERNGNDVQDYLVNSGYQGRLLTVADYKTAVQNHVGTVQAVITWNGGKCEVCQKYTVKKLKDFPLLADGRPNHVAPCPDCGEPVGAKVKIVMFKAKR